MRRIVRKAALAALGAALLPASAARAALNASATISDQQVGPNSYKYSLTLTNSATSTVSAASFWFGWFPGYDLLPDSPTAFTAPANWNGINAPDSFGIASAQFTTSTAPLAPGQTLSGFSFTTPDSPSAIIGATSPYFSAPVDETYVYSVAPESGSVTNFQPSLVVPEPNSALVLLGLPWILLVRRRKDLRVKADSTT